MQKLISFEGIPSSLNQYYLTFYESPLFHTVTNSHSTHDNLCFSSEKMQYLLGIFRRINKLFKCQLRIIIQNFFETIERSIKD